MKAKAEAAVEGGLTAIVCVGESEAERESGDASRSSAVRLFELADAASATNTVIAYEPLWAIGTGKVPTVEQIAEMHLHIQSLLTQEFERDSAKIAEFCMAVRLMQRTRVKFWCTDGVGGALVGGASLKAESFLAISRSCP